MKQSLSEPSVMSRRDLLAGAAGGALLAAHSGSTSASVKQLEPNPASIDSIVERFMREFDIPGIGVAIVRPDGPPVARGYGIRTLGLADRVDPHTQFAIASNSKAFLSACFALLVDDGKLRWDDPVVQYLPEFRMYDPAVTSMMTVRDLFLHRSGLPLGAGDLLQFPATNATAEDVLHALRYLKPSTGFRAGYAYDNGLYIVAGILLGRVSGMSWERFVTERIFVRLGMVDAVAIPSRVNSTNHAGRHARIGPPVRGMGTLAAVLPDETDVVGPAGGINVSVTGILPWLRVQLARGVLPDGTTLWSAGQSAEMWKPQTITSSSTGPTVDQPQRAVLQAYALGWFVEDFRGRRVISHRGTVSGQRSHTVLVPEQGLGFVVYSNTEDFESVFGLRYALLDGLLGVTGFDWVAASRRDIVTAQAAVLHAVTDGEFKAPPGGPTLPLDHYAGRYRDPWYGDVLVTQANGGLAIDFTRTPVLKGQLEPFGSDVFRTRFAVGVEDAVVTFNVRDGAVSGITMKALSPMADFSFDYHDLAFVRSND